LQGYAWIKCAEGYLLRRLSSDLKMFPKDLELSKVASLVNRGKRRESYQQEVAGDVISQEKGLINGWVIDSLGTIVVKELTAVARDITRDCHIIITGLAELRLFIIVVKASA